MLIHLLLMKPKFQISMKVMSGLSSNKNKGKPPMGFVANIDTSNKVVSFVYDAGGHGTHVAGIVSGFGINGEKGFNGVAPGSQLVCCKFSCDSVDDITITEV